MRARHWAELSDAIGIAVDPDAPRAGGAKFTLTTVVELGLAACQRIRRSNVLDAHVGPLLVRHSFVSFGELDLGLAQQFAVTRH
jgi:hypothetical protein